MSIFDDIGDAFKSAGETIGSGVVTAGETVGKGMATAGETVGDGVVTGGKAAVQGMQDVATGDAFFPDNPHREARCKEIAGDISQISYRLTADNQQVQRNLQNLNATIADVYRAKGLTPPAAATIGSVDYHQTAYQVSELTAPLLAVGAVRYALTDTAVVAEVEGGEIGAEAGAAALGAEGLGFGPGLAIAAAVTAMIGAIQGAEKRSKLQSYIHDSFGLRQRLKQSELLDMRLVNALAGASSSISVLRGLNYNAAQIGQAIETILAAAKKTLEYDVTGDANAQLTHMDQSRGSWTNEDT